MDRALFPTGIVLSMLLVSPAIGSDGLPPTQPTAPTCHKPRESGGTSRAVQPGAQARGCLVSVVQLRGDAPVIDLRPRSAYAAFHVPGASNQQLSQLLAQRPSGVAVYDSGRLSQDGMLLCERLQHYGLSDVQVIEGGIAAWAQSRGAPQAMDVSRLDDNEVASALLAGRTPVVALSAAFQPVIAGLSSSPPRSGRQEIVLAETADAASRRVAQRRGATTTLYWVGEPQRLQSLLQRLLAQDRKREVGPGYSPTCSAL